MKFDKPPLIFADQIKQLEARGLIFKDKPKAENYLSNISYYRLSAYWFTFQKTPVADHIFKENTAFESVIDTYVFDRKLRILVFDEIERIEIALRTQIIYFFCHAFGPNWYEQADLFNHRDNFEKFQALMQAEMNKTSEVFISHYKSKYTDPCNPPSWMVLELASFGQLSILFKNLKMNDCKKEIANHFGVHYTILTSWLETISYVRNTCAHHMRLWNRKLPKTIINPKITKYPWLKIAPHDDDVMKLYLALSSIMYLLKAFIPKSSFHVRLKELISNHPTIPLYYMGFPNEWDKEQLWN